MFPGSYERQDLAFAPFVAVVAGGEVTTSSHIVGESLPLGSCLYGDEGGCRSDARERVKFFFFVLGLWKIPIFGGIKQCKYMIVLREVPKIIVHCLGW